MTGAGPNGLVGPEPFVSDVDFRLYVGDVREVLATLPAGSVDCCVTSPPYWGLRDYQTGTWAGGDPDCDHKKGGQPTWGAGSTGSSTLASRSNNDSHERETWTGGKCGKCGATRTDSQIGLEATPELFVAELVSVFREVRRVLADHGTLWLNLGDSYATQRNDNDWLGSGATAIKGNRVPIGLKPKDLVGIPWAVAKALQSPYYTGRIAAERDRVWLAATIDAEGSICGFTHERADGDGTRTGIHITITNTSMALLAEAQRIWPTSRDDGNGHGPSALGTRECRRWIAHNVDDKAALLAELYPYLIAKKQQALLAWNFLEMSKIAKRIGKSSERLEAKQRRAWIVSALSDLNHGREVDMPSWVMEPEGMWERGWFLRSEIIWAKLCRTPCLNP